MFIDKIKLRNFRNYENAVVDFNSRLNLIIGENAQGKSNLLEAIQMSICGESFRSVNNEELIRKNSENLNAIIESDFLVNDGLKKEIKLNLLPKKTLITINGKSLTKVKLQSQFSSILFSPDSLSVVKDGPQKRREFIDLIAQSLFREKVELFYEYKKCLRARNKLLKNYAESQTFPSEMLLVYESLNDVYLPLCTSIIALRQKTINFIKNTTKNVLRDLLKDMSVDISVDYVISSKSAIDWSENQVYDALKSRLKELRAAELSAGTSLIGPHKHDVRFLFNGRDARTYCSQGQQRAVTLAFKIAQILKFYELHEEYPVLLLDDVFSELDFERRDGLMKVLSDTPAQIFISATEWDLNNRMGKENFKLIKINKGKAE